MCEELASTFALQAFGLFVVLFRLCLAPPWPSRESPPTAVCVGIFRVESDGLVEVGDGLGVLTRLVAPRPAPTAVGIGVFRIEADVLASSKSASALSYWFLLPTWRSSSAAVGFASSSGRVRDDGLGAIGDGFIPLPLVEPCAAAFDVGVGFGRVEPDGLGIVRDRPVHVPLEKHQSGSTIKVDMRIFRVESDRLGVVINGLGVFLQGAPGTAPADVVVCLLGVESDGFGEVGDGLFGAATTSQKASPRSWYM